jgi:hypothetical protein
MSDQKELNEHQYVEIAAQLAIVAQPIPVEIQRSIVDSMELFILGLGEDDRVKVQDKVFARVRVLAEVHADTLSRQFRGARNASTD